METVPLLGVSERFANSNGLALNLRQWCKVILVKLLKKREAQELGVNHFCTPRNLTQIKVPFFFFLLLRN